MGKQIPAELAKYHIRFTMYRIDALRKISRSIHYLDEVECNYGKTPRQTTQLNNLLKKADELAKELKLRAYHQGDPRGCSLYLVEKLQGCETNYTDGVAIGSRG